MMSESIARSGAACIVAGLVALASVATPARALAQASARADEEARLLAGISEEQSRDGSYAPGTISALAALGEHYQALGEHRLAAETLARALQASRANYGLDALEHVPLILELLESEEALGNIESSWRLTRLLSDIATQHPRDVVTAPILREVADRQLEAYQQYLDGRLPRRLDLGILAPPLGRFAALPDGSSTSVVVGILGPPSQRSSSADMLRVHAATNYRRAADLLVGDGQHSSPLLREIEMQVVRLAWSAAPRDYWLGRDGYRRVSDYEATSGAHPLQRIATRIELADWDLLFIDGNGASADEREPVLGVYEAAYRLLTESGAARDEEMEALFSPRIPVVLPTFLPNPLHTEPTPATAGYIDVAFDVAETGFAERIDVVGGNAAKDAERALVRLIKRSRFRPRLVEGRVQAADRVVVRYHLQE